MKKYSYQQKTYQLIRRYKKRRSVYEILEIILEILNLTREEIKRIEKIKK